jgi:mRNA-degrading endonuclease RelE of RelBE toxin-antitoxin system
MKSSNDPFEVIFSPKIYKQIKHLDEELKERIKKAAIEVGDDPWHDGTIKVRNYENIRRKRVGKYRLLYTIDKERKEVLIVKIEKRGETTYK